MRQAFVKGLCEAAKKDKRIFLMTGDLGFNILEPFRDQFPERFLNIGVAEANLMTVAAGLSTTGFIPFVYSIATFASMRPFEQIRNDIALQNLNVKIVGVGGGLAYTKAGPTHHSMEDIALMRTLPNMTIVAPCNQDETYQATKAIAKHKGPVYLRIERNPDEPTRSVTSQFQIGKGEIVKKGRGIALLSTGTKLSNALDVASLLKKHGINPSVYAFPTIKPLDKDLLLQIVENHYLIATIEEHRISGGFGTAVAEFITNPKISKPTELVRFGLKDTFTSISADYQTMLKYHEFLPGQIAKKLLALTETTHKGG